MEHKQPTHQEELLDNEPERLTETQSHILTETRSALISPIFLVFLYSLVQVILHSIWIDGPTGHYIFMIIGSVISFVCVTMYTRTVFHPRSNELLKAPSMTIAYVVIFLFACYITFYQGFWGFVELTNGFSVWVILKSILAIIVGRNIAKAASHISDQVKSVEKI